MLCPGKQGWSRHFEYSGSLLPSPFERAPFIEKTVRKELRSPMPHCPALFSQNSFGSIFLASFQFLRVLSGILSGDVNLKNMRSGRKREAWRSSLSYRQRPDTLQGIWGPGAIVAVAKLKNTRTGDTLSDEKSAIYAFVPPLPPQLITYALAPMEKARKTRSMRQFSVCWMKISR